MEDVPDAPARILLVEGDEDHAAACERALTDALGGVEITSVRSAAEGLGHAMNAVFDVVVVGTRPAGIHELDLLRLIRRQRAEVPLIALVGPGSEWLAATALKAGASDYVHVDDTFEVELSDRVRALHEGRGDDSRSRHVIALSERLDAEHELHGVLEAAMMGATLTMDADGVSVWLTTGYDSVDAHLNVPLAEGPEVVAGLFSGPLEAGEVEVVFPATVELSLGHLAGAAAARARGSMGDEVHVLLVRREAPWAPADARWLELVARSMLNAATRVLERDRLAGGAAFDELTGLPSRQRFLATLRAEIERARRLGSSVAVAVVRVDDVEQIAAEHGSEVLDGALRDIASTLAGTLRSYDIPARIGEAEFAAILPGIDRLRAETVAERIRAAVRNCEFPAFGRLSVDCGVVAYPTAAARETR